MPAERPDALEEEEAEAGEQAGKHVVEVVLASRFPGLKRKLKNFDFKRRYGAEVKEIRQGGQVITENLGEVRLQQGDTLVLVADDAFTRTWGDSSVFLMMTNGNEIPTRPVAAWKKWTALALLLVMIVGATVGELPAVQERFPGVKMDMFFFASVTAVVMAWLKLFPPKKYTKYISWDILITIACALRHKRGNGGVGPGRAHSRLHKGRERKPRGVGCARAALRRDAAHHRADNQQRCGRAGASRSRWRRLPSSAWTPCLSS